MNSIEIPPHDEKIIIGTDENDKIKAGGLDNYIYGLGDADVIYGDGGNDKINGGDGNDFIWGQDGNDYLRGGQGNDILWGENGNDWIIGDSENDTLYGADGNDRLDGGAGRDVMYGGPGDDSYYTDNFLDVVKENVGEGKDHVYSFVNYTLPENVEYLSLMGHEDINGTGNELNNQIGGNNFDNIICGLGGNDILKGGYGNDTYAEYVDGSGCDTIWDKDGYDTLDISGWSCKVEIFNLDADHNGYFDNLYIKCQNLTDDSLLIQNFYDNTAVGDAGAGYIENIIYPV